LAPSPESGLAVTDPPVIANFLCTCAREAGYGDLPFSTWKMFILGICRSEPAKGKLLAKGLGQSYSDQTKGDGPRPIRTVGVMMLGVKRAVLAPTANSPSK